MTQNGLALQWASEELQRDPEVLLEALKSAKQQGKENFLFVLEHISNLENPNAIDLCNQNQELFLFLITNLLPDDRQTLTDQKQSINLSINTYIAMYAATSQFNERATILEAVEQNGLALRFASKELQKDPEIKLKALLSQYRKAENDQEKQRFRADIINLVVENLNDRRPDGKPTNIISCIDFAQFGDIRRDPEIIKAILKNYTTQPEINSNLELAIAGAGGNFNLTEYCKKMKTAQWRLELTYD